MTPQERLYADLERILAECPEVAELVAAAEETEQQQKRKEAVA